MSMLELALSYARQGFTVLPVNPSTKAALTSNWTNAPAKGAPGSSKDPDQVRAWWTQWPDACVGLRTGKINGLVVVDIDKHGVSDGFKTIKTFDGRRSEVDGYRAYRRQRAASSTTPIPAN